MMGCAGKSDVWKERRDLPSPVVALEHRDTQRVDHSEGVAKGSWRAFIVGQTSGL